MLTQEDPPQMFLRGTLNLTYRVNQTNLLVDCNLHETTESADALNADGCAGIRVDHTSCWGQRIPVLIEIVEL